MNTYSRIAALIALLVMLGLAACAPQSSPSALPQAPEGAVPEGAVLANGQPGSQPVPPVVQPAPGPNPTPQAQATMVPPGTWAPNGSIQLPTVVGYTAEEVLIGLIVGFGGIVFFVLYPIWEAHKEKKPGVTKWYIIGTIGTLVASVVVLLIPGDQYCVGPLCAPLNPIAVFAAAMVVALDIWVPVTLRANSGPIIGAKNDTPDAYKEPFTNQQDAEAWRRTSEASQYITESAQPTDNKAWRVPVYEKSLQIGRDGTFLTLWFVTRWVIAFGTGIVFGLKTMTILGSPVNIADLYFAIALVNQTREIKLELGDTFNRSMIWNLLGNAIMLVSPVPVPIVGAYAIPRLMAANDEKGMAKGAGDLAMWNMLVVTAMVHNVGWHWLLHLFSPVWTNPLVMSYVTQFIKFVQVTVSGG